MHDHSAAGSSGGERYCFRTTYIPYQSDNSCSLLIIRDARFMFQLQEVCYCRNLPRFGLSFTPPFCPHCRPSLCLYRSVSIASHTCTYVHFVCCFFPASFYQLKGLSVRALTLISFRDVVLLKLDIAGNWTFHTLLTAKYAGQKSCSLSPTQAALECGASVPPEIKQMLLVLQSVHKTPPSDQFFQLQALVERVVQPYLCLVTRTRVASRAPFELSQEGRERMK